MSSFRILFSAFFGALATAASAQTSEAPAPSPRSAAAPEVSSTLKTVQHEDQVFTLASSSSGPKVATDEYVLAGEKITEWSQLVTVQRLTLSKPTPADEFLAYFQKRVRAESGATLEILKEGNPASVFVARFARSDSNDEQVMICLVFKEAARPDVLNIVQYAVKPSRVSADLAEMRLRSWRDRFLAQAAAAGD